MDKKVLVETTSKDVLTGLQSAIEGISGNEILRRRLKYGENAFRKGGNGTLGILVRQFNNAIVYLLLAACVASYFAHSYSDTWIIAIVLLANTLLGFFQEYRSVKTLERLAGLVKRHVLVRRGGMTSIITQEELVPGDIVILKEGDIIPADCKVLEADDFATDESQLTGESLPVNKRPGIGEESILFAGSVVDNGEATAVVFATAEDTELGRIAHLSRTTRRVTQYEKSLQSFSYLLMKITLLMVPLIFLVKIFVLHGSGGISESLVFMFAFAIAVVPEALPAVVTVTLAQGAQRLSRHFVVVKKLSAIEDLGNVTVLCTDKTGTLTENKLGITEVVSDDPVWLQILANASIEIMDEKRKRLASAFDQAFADYLSPELKERVKQFKKLKELPFDPQSRRRRVVLEDVSDGKHWLVDVGSAETLFHDAQSGHRPGTLEEIAEDGRKGLRHLGVSVREVQYHKEFNIMEHERHMHFLGFVKLTDPLKPTAIRTIKAAQQLGVQVKILTGDSVEVAGYVGRQIGLVQDGEKVYGGDEIEAMHPEQLRHILQKTHVFAKITPEQKYTIIRLLKESGAVVAYQGDGINDAPSLKLADVAIAVNTATDVAKDSADILLLKADLGVVITGIKNGRTIFSNVNKYIRYTMIGNFSSLFTLAALYLLGSDLPLLPTQLLIVSSFTQLPFTAVASDTVKDDELAIPSRYDVKGIMLLGLVMGTVTSICQLAYFVAVKGQPLATSQTALTVYLTLVQLIVAFSVRNKDHFWKAGKPSLTFGLTLAVTIAVSVAMVYVSPVKEWFSFIPLQGGLLAMTLAATLAYLVLIDLVKTWFYHLPGEQLIAA